MAERILGNEPTVTLRERPFLTMLTVRVPPISPQASRIAEALAVSLPQRCGDVEQTERHAVLWLGPDEWLVVSLADAAILREQLNTALGSDHGAVVDVSANRTTLELAGPAARDVLDAGCALDLHPRAFGPDTAVATQVGPVPVILWQTNDASTYRLLPRSSFAEYLTRWLLDAMPAGRDASTLVATQPAWAAT